MNAILSLVVLALVVCACSAQNNQTFCQKYTIALFGNDTQANEVNLVSSVVTRAVLGAAASNITNNITVQGIVGANSTILRFFNGSFAFRKDGSTVNFLTNTTAYNALAGKLVNYFGNLLGCTYFTVAMISNPNLYQIHQNMGITQSDETYFNTQIANSLLSFGVSPADVTSAATILGEFNYCGNILYGGPVQICGDVSCSIATNAMNTTACNSYYRGTLCSKYTSALFGSDTTYNENALVTAVVTRVAVGSSSPAVQGIMAPGSSILQFFNGSVIFRANGQPVDFTANNYNNANLVSLAAHLVDFFGGLLGCNAPGYNVSTSYNWVTGNNDMFAVHQNMGITQTQMNYFITQLGATLTSFGVSSSDVSAAATALTGFQRCAPAVNGLREQICGTSTCALAPNATCSLYNAGFATYSFPSLIMLMSLAFIALSSIILM